MHLAHIIGQAFMMPDRPSISPSCCVEYLDVRLVPICTIAPDSGLVRPSTTLNTSMCGSCKLECTAAVAPERLKRIKIRIRIIRRYSFKRLTPTNASNKCRPKKLLHLLADPALYASNARPR